MTRNPAIAAIRTKRILAPAPVTLVNHTYPAYIHQIRISTRRPRRKSSAPSAFSKRPVSCVIAKTKISSKKSSTLETRRTWALGAGGSARASGVMPCSQPPPAQPKGPSKAVSHAERARGGLGATLPPEANRLRDEHVREEEAVRDGETLTDGYPPLRRHLSMRRILLGRRWSGFVGPAPGVMVKMELVDLAKDERIFLLRLHLHDDGQHPQPHRRIRHKPDGRRDENRNDRTREEASKADGIQGPMEDDLGRDGCRREKSDQPEPLNLPIVDRCLSQVEETVIPLDEPPHHGDEWHSVLSVLMLGGRVSTSDIQRRVARPLQRVRFRH